MPIAKSRMFEPRRVRIIYKINIQLDRIKFLGYIQNSQPDEFHNCHVTEEDRLRAQVTAVTWVVSYKLASCWKHF